MKNSIYKLAAAALAIGGLSSCDDWQSNVEGEGLVKLSTTISNDVTVVSRSQSDEINESLAVWISNSKGVVREYHGLSNVPSEGISLYSGSYTVEGWAGTKAWASWEDKWYEGSDVFVIEKGKTSNVTLTCKLQNTLVSVIYEDGAKDVLHDYTMTVGHIYGELTFEGDDERKGYFYLSDDDRTITYTLKGTTNTGDEFTRTQTIENAKASTEYVLTVTHTSEDSEIGGAYLTIVVDENEVEVEDDNILAVAPQIDGYKNGKTFDISQTVRGEETQIGRVSIYVRAACALESVTLEGSVLGTHTGIGGDDVNLMGMTDAIEAQLANDGINFSYDYYEDIDESIMKINLEKDFTDKLIDGDYSLTIKAVDVNGKSTTKTLKIVVSPAPVNTSAVDINEVYTNRATLRAEKLKDADSYGFNYRSVESRSSAWTYIEGELIDDEIIASISGLTPDTEYEYTAVAGDFVSDNILTFTTEAAAQLPNCGFEEWQDSSAPYLIYASGSEMFWDSGNHGSSTMKKNVTEPDNTVLHSGNYSAKLASQFVGIGTIGKFAAGNIFIGEYLATDGTDGVLGWGRSFTSRPTALKVWVKYVPVAVTHEVSEFEDLKKGDMDEGIIYVALLDETLQEYNGSKYPVIIKTKSSERSLFDKTAANVIAYGEQIITEDTTGDNMVQITIPIDYHITGVKPAYIMLTCAASRGGDYFVGGNGSNMWLDDIELVYE